MIGWLETIVITAFAAGLLNGVHCAAMCGGIAGATCAPGCGARPAAGRWRRALAYNAGRITSYAAGGVLAGALGAAGLSLRGGASAQQIVMAAAGVALLVYALVIAGYKPAVRTLEDAGALLWRHVRPLSRRFLPADNAARAYGLGLAWGWLPCGMVYAMLITALATGSAVEGALVMLAFGLGTLPNLLLIATFWDYVRRALASRIVQAAAALLIASAGVFSLIQASQPAHAMSRSGFFCMALPGLNLQAH